MKTKVYTIFALIRDDIAYIGKTAGKRVSAVFSSHICGEHLSTKKHFAKPAPSPILHILHRSEMQPYQAYKHVLAYVRVFQEENYTLLNCPRSIERSAELKEDTREIYNNIKRANFSDLLKASKVKKATDADLVKRTSVDHEKENSFCQLTMRLAQDEKRHFNEIGESLHFNQRQTLLYMFDKLNQTDPVFIDLYGDTYLRALFDSLREENEKLKNANLALSQKLKISRDDKSRKLAAAREAFNDVVAGIAEYFSLMENADPIPLEIEYGLYREFEGRKNYTYPNAPGLYLVRPQMVLRGKGRYSSLFIMGVTQEGRCLQFRYYPKKDFAGIPIPNSRFATRGSLWLVGCRQANDGSMDLYCSFPINIRHT